MSNNQKGLTLLELMVAIVLGLLIVAASLAIFLSAQRSSNLQSSLDALQQNANFGLSMLAFDLRHTNLNTESAQKVNNKVVGSGIILGLANLPSTLSGTDIKYLTASSIHEDAAGEEKSDQITIQFVPELSTDPRYDCEGAKMLPNRTYVYSYYLEKLPDSQQIPGALDRFGLYCDSGYYTSSMNQIDGLGDNGQVVIQNADAFKIRLLVRDKDQNLAYTTLNNYLTTMMGNTVAVANYKYILGVEIGVLITSSHSIASDAQLNTTDTYQVAGQIVKLKANAQNSKYLRQPVTQFVALRNTLGAI